VAIVLFSPAFFDSKWCLQELRTVVDAGAINGAFTYLPVFFTMTVAEVSERARVVFTDPQVLRAVSPLAYGSAGRCNLLARSAQRQGRLVL
jgi:hypothetical protein